MRRGRPLALTAALRTWRVGPIADGRVRPPWNARAEPGDGANEIRVSRKGTCAALKMESLPSIWQPVSARNVPSMPPTS